MNNNNHHYMGIEMNNQTWGLLDKKDRREQDRRGQDRRRGNNNENGNGNGKGKKKGACFKGITLKTYLKQIHKNIGIVYKHVLDKCDLYPQIFTKKRLMDFNDDLSEINKRIQVVNRDKCSERYRKKR